MQLTRGDELTKNPRVALKRCRRPPNSNWETMTRDEIVQYALALSLRVTFPHAGQAGVPSLPARSLSRHARSVDALVDRQRTKGRAVSLVGTEQAGVACSRDSERQRTNSHSPSRRDDGGLGSTAGVPACVLFVANYPDVGGRTWGLDLRSRSLRVGREKSVTPLSTAFTVNVLRSAVRGGRASARSPRALAGTELGT